MDGSDNNDEDIGVRRQGFVALVPQSLESVEDFQILTAGFPAEFGRNSGAMVNAVSRSGKSQTHGKLYGLLNNDVLNARNFFERKFRDSVNPGPLNGGSFQDDDFRSAQYGGVIGGPIVAEDLFYFVSAEAQNRSGSRLGHFVVPSIRERGLRARGGFIPIDQLGDFFTDGNIPYSDLAGSGIFSLYPLPNHPLGPFGENTYFQRRRQEASASIFSVKFDGYLSSVHSAAGRYNFTDDRSLLPFTSEAIDSSLATDVRTQNLSLFLNSTTPSRGNALRFSCGRTSLAFPTEKSSPLLFGSASSDLLPQQFAQVIQTDFGNFGPFGATGPIGQLAIVPFSPIGIDVFNFPQGRVDNTWQVSDFVTWTREKHTVKVGFDIRRTGLDSFADRNSRPLLLFGYGFVSQGCLINLTCPFGTEDGLLRGTDTAALGAPSGFLQALNTQPDASSRIRLGFTQYDVFVQDDWKLAPNFTFNWGLRYELQTVPTESSRRIENSFDLSPDRFGHLPVTGSAQDQRIIAAGNAAFDQALAGWLDFLGGRKKIYQRDGNNFAPRLGFSWDPKGSGKTAIRGGYGVSYDAQLGAITSQSRNVFPNFVPLNLDLNFRLPSGLFVNSPSFFSFIPTGATLIRPGTLNSYNLPPEAFATGLGTLFVQAPPLPGASLSSNGLAFTLPEQELPAAYAQHFVLGLERQFSQDWLATLHYVGTRGLHLARFVTPNAGLISTPLLLSSPRLGLNILDLPPRIDSSEETRPRAGLGAFSVFQNSASSAYHSLQTSIEQRFRKGLQFRLQWTWSHALDEVSDPFDARGFFSLPQSQLQLKQERASASFDARHRLSSFFVWQLPGGASNRWLRGWTLSAIGEFQTGQPFTLNSVQDRNLDGNLTDRPDWVDSISIHPGSSHLLRLGSADALDLLAVRGENGKVGRNTFRGDGMATLDLGLSRALELGETSRLNLRLEVFNVFNQTHFGLPIRSLESPALGRSFDTQVESRSMRFGFGFSF